MIRRRLTASIAALAVIASGLLWGGAPASATNTSPLAATYGASAAVDVERTPPYPRCSGTNFDPWTVKSTGNPISQTAYNDTGSYADSRVNLSAVPHDGTTDPALLKISQVGGADNWALKLYIAPAGTQELFWNATTNEWTTTATGNTSFAPGGLVYALYSGGFLHEGVKSGSGLYEIGTFLMIDGTLPSGYTLNYVPSPVTDNVCTSLKTRATATGMASTTLGGSGTIISPASEATIPQITIQINANGGRCSVSEVTGPQGTWTKAPYEGSCARTGKAYMGFNTKADGSGLAIAAGGNLNLTSDNTLYAQWEDLRTAGAPTDVVATPGLKTITVNWKAPTDAGTGTITNYLVQATPGGAVCITRLIDANMLECTFTSLTPGVQYTFKVQALNPAGWGAFSAASNVTSPLDLLADTVERVQNKILFIKTGSTLTVDGRAPGYAPGTVITPQLKIGENGSWVSETRDLPKVPAEGPNKRFTWTKKLNKSINNQPVEVRFVIGGITSNSMKANIGTSLGLPSAPRDVKVSSSTAGIKVEWKAPAKNGGSPITSYEVTSDLDKLSCTVKAPETSCTQMPRKWGAHDPNKRYTFEVVAKTARGTGPEAKAQWRGEIYRLNIFYRGNSQDMVFLRFAANGFSCSQKFEVQSKIEENGKWKKVGTATTDYQPCEIGEWSATLPKVDRWVNVYYRLKSPNGYSNERRIVVRN